MNKNIVLVIISTILVYASQSYSLEAGQSSCSFNFVSDPEGAMIYINNVYYKVTPCKIDTLPPGEYQVKVEKEGYYVKIIKEKLNENMHQRVFVQLEEMEEKIKGDFGSLEITSEPDDATILLDSVILGKTPFSSDSVKIGTYTISITKPRHFSFENTISIVNTYPNTINVTLISKDSVTLKRKKNFQKTRRILFGAITACFLAYGTIAHFNLNNAISAEEEALASYRELNLDPELYDLRYMHYSNCVEITNMLIKHRKYGFLLGGLAGAGFVISIPF